MSNLELNDPEQEALTEVLKNALSELRSEVGRTDRETYRAHLKEQEYWIKGILNRLESGKTAGVH